MSALEIILILVVVTAISAGAYQLLLGGDRHQRRIESVRTDALPHINAPSVTDHDRPDLRL